MGPGGYLDVTGHDDPELYVLAFQAGGPTPKWVATIAVPSQGQAFDRNPAEPGIVDFLVRGTREIIVGRVDISRP